ncbi:hypothetical protein Rsub_07829 [Raphidocelis subcapitata]|uniref:Homogentisate prenyltransferase n=1 Tax=Raphidocelis subcapitata TaxID=307507 RepID=A0A2V0P7E6_9CHLO|nr:hypothetical protein Rsub_07829 [Raphidocelis subcapitata]|eukprot:GBF95479.1 hypothetical protein Rsub_07829 [Raphidocelis subcapitata]
MRWLQGAAGPLGHARGAVVPSSLGSGPSDRAGRAASGCSCSAGPGSLSSAALAAAATAASAFAAPSAAAAAARAPLPPRRRRRLGAPASAAAGAAAGAPGGESPAARAAAFLSAFWKFLRPHTIRGTILGTTAVVTRALLDSPAAIDWALLPRACLGLVALLCGNGYIVGINQIYDVEIDALNKPFLPVAAGELSTPAAWALVAGLAATGLAITATNFGPLISSLYAFGLLLGTVYSIPPLRLKRFAIPAFLIIATVRGFLLNFGVYHATRAALQLPFAWSPPITFITCFVTMFATVIAITKDLPDVEGDRAHGISTFATRLGVPAVSNLGIGLLMANYAGAIYAGLTCPAFNAPLMVGAHAALATILALRALKLARSGYTREGVQKFYVWIWNLFYSEYFLLPWI